MACLKKIINSHYSKIDSIFVKLINLTDKILPVFGQAENSKVSQPYQYFFCERLSSHQEYMLEWHVWHARKVTRALPSIAYSSTYFQLTIEIVNSISDICFVATSWLSLTKKLGIIMFYTGGQDKDTYQAAPQVTAPIRPVPTGNNYRQYYTYRLHNRYCEHNKYRQHNKCRQNNN